MDGTRTKLEIIIYSHSCCSEPVWLALWNTKSDVMQNDNLLYSRVFFHKMKVNGTHILHNISTEEWQSYSLEQHEAE